MPSPSPHRKGPAVTEVPRPSPVLSALRGHRRVGPAVTHSQPRERRLRESPGWVGFYS